MKKTFTIFIVTLLLFAFIACSDTSGSTFTKHDNGNIADSNGTEYVFLANEGIVCSFGTQTFIGKIDGEKESFIHLSLPIQTGMFACENDTDKRILIRNVPDNEFQAYYRRADLPVLDLSPDNCIRFELLKDTQSTENIVHMTCGDGLTEKGQISEFLSDLRSAQTASEAGLYELIKKDDGSLENCYMYGIIYGFFEGETNLAILLQVTSFNDKAYSVDIDGKNYVLPEKWLAELEAATSK